MQPQNRRNFTLVELMTVIVIIMILIGILLPTIGIVIRKAEENQTKVRIKNLVLAIKQYESQYGTLPDVSNNDDGDGDARIFENTTDNELLISLLTNVETTANTGGNARGIRFLEPITPQDPNTYTDAWGKEFRIKLDTNYDGELSGDGIPGINTGDTIFTQVSVVSFGADETLGTFDDNVTNWED